MTMERQASEKALWMLEKHDIGRIRIGMDKAAIRGLTTTWKVKETKRATGECLGISDCAAWDGNRDEKSRKEEIY